MTYSIVARDPETGELGVAVQTKNFGVGAIVPWARPGVGAIATQSFSDAGYGAIGLDLLEAGKTPAEALAALVAGDRLSAHRQVGVVGPTEAAAAHTGDACIPEAGHVTGEGFSVQANMMRSQEVWPAMADAYGAAEGTLAHRLLTALDAAETAGGDFRGRQSAALLVYGAEPRGAPWKAVVSDLRVDDHPEPLTELRRLLAVEEATRRLRRAGDDSLDDLAVAARAAGVDEDEIVWTLACAAAKRGDLDQARTILDPLVVKDARWSAALDSFVLAVTTMGE